MKKFLFILILLIQCGYVFSQNYTIRYRPTYKVANTTIGLRQFILTIQDTVAYCYYPDILPGGVLPVPLGSAYFPKSSYYNFKKQILMYHQGHPKRPKTHRIIQKNYLLGEWIIDGDKKEILGYTCIKAHGTNGNRSYIVWYSPDLPHGFGPFMMTGLPGTILQSLDVERGYLTWAIEIKKGGLPIVEPNFAEKIYKDN